jgi:hypothetical protein
MTSSVTLLVATPPDGIGNQLWAAAVPPDQAVQAVLKQLSQGWTVNIADHQLDAGQISMLNLQPGEVTEFSRGMARRRE